MRKGAGRGSLVSEDERFMRMALVEAEQLGNYRMEGCDLYVTIEPCAMCAGAIVQARLRRLVYGARDPKAGACGSALRVLNHCKLNHKVNVVGSIMASDCASLIREFFRKRRREDQPKND
jgi:tRNA(adenine34) deaminase